MKRMIRNLSFVFHVSILNNSLIIILLLCAGFSYQKEENITKINEIRIYTKNNSLLTLDNDSIYVLIIKNNKSCLNCFQTVSSYLIELSKQYTVNLLAISHSESNSLSRKRNIYELNTLFPNSFQYGVSYSESWNDKITTPELLVIKKNIIHHFPYEDIFANGFEIISPEVQNKIISILKNE